MTVHNQGEPDDTFVRTITRTIVRSIEQPGWQSWLKVMATIIVFAAVAIVLKLYGII